MTPQEAADVVKAYYVDGVQIQLYAYDKWEDVNHPSFDSFHINDYRVKPIPKVIWVNEYLVGASGVHLTEKAAIAMRSPNGTTTKYQEVL